MKYQRVFSCHEESVSPKTMWQFSKQLKPRFFVQCLRSVWGKQLSMNLLWTLLLVLLYWSMCTKSECWHFLVLFHDALHSSFVQWSPFVRRWQKVYSSSLKSMAPESDWIHLHVLSASVYDGFHHWNLTTFFRSTNQSNILLWYNRHGKLFYVLNE